jgi:hypothetical protein
MNPMLETIAKQASEDLIDEFAEAEKDLLNAIQKAEKESALQESPLKFNIGFKISLDLEKRIVTNTLSWSVKQSLETSHQIDDPEQKKLPLEETKMTISATDMKPIETTLGELKKLHRILTGKPAKGASENTQETILRKPRQRAA